MSANCDRSLISAWDRSDLGIEDKPTEPMPWWLWPNVLSLDAPAVALVWHVAFARAFEETVDVTTVVLLGAAVWCVYVLDRLLDVRRMVPSEASTWRHRFHARHARIFAAAVAVVVVASIGLLFHQGDRDLLVFGLVTGGLCLVYGTLAHWRPGRVPKELACGFIFAIGVVGPLGLSPWPWGELLFFALLCTSNCLVIALAEREADRAHDRAAWPQRWPGIRPWLGWGMLVLLAIASLRASHVLGPEEEPLMMAMVLAYAGLWALLYLRWSPDLKRALADVCLLSPLPFWVFQLAER